MKKESEACNGSFLVMKTVMKKYMAPEKASSKKEEIPGCS